MAIAIISEMASPACRTSLQARGFIPISAPSSENLCAPLKAHPDMHFARLGNEIFCAEDFFHKNEAFFSHLASLCKKVRITPLPDRIGALYPSDCAYNLLCMTDAVFYNEKSIAPALLEKAKALGYRLFPTRQGYARCTVCPLGSRHAITADEGMADALTRAGISVLKIQSRGISLLPYEYGFIGGASGAWEGTVYFYGNIAAHPDFSFIESFAEAAGFRLASLSDEPLTDLGGILFLE